MKNKKIIVVFVFLLVMAIIPSINAESINDPDGYEIVEKTEYSIGTNTVYITITDNTNSKKDVNVTFNYQKGDKTLQLDHTDMNMKSNVTKPVYGIVNTTLGKYGTKNTITENNTDYYEYEDSNNNRLCLENIDTGNYTGCDYILSDKSILKEESQQIDTKEVPEWIDINSDQETEKENLADKIHFKNGYLPLGKVKDSNKVELKLKVKHPIFTENYQVPEDQNKYNITVESADGSYKTVLDPTWWNESYDYRYKHNDNGSNYKGIGHFGINSTLLGTNGWYGLLGDNAYTYEDSDNNNFAVGNETDELCWYDSETDSGNSINCEDGLISHYTLDRNSGDVQDWISGNDGTNNGATRGVTGKVNNAFDFDGSNDYIQANGIPTSFDMSNNFSINLWVNHDVEAGGEWVFYIEDSGSSEFIGVAAKGEGYRIMTDGRTAENPSIDESTGNWYMITLIWNSSVGEVSIYNNAVKDYSSSISGSWLSSLDNMIIGDGDEEAFDGKIDDVRIYDRALSSTEVSNLYSSQSTNKPYLGTQEVQAFFNIEDDFSDSIDYGSNYTYQIKYNSSSDISEFNINNSDFTINNSGYLYTNNYIDSGNYSLYVNATNNDDIQDELYIDLEVNKIPLEITADNITKVYGDPDPSLTYNLNESLKADDEIIGNLDRNEGENVGDYTITQGNLTIDNEQNYNIYYNSGILTINKKYIEISINDQLKEYNSTDPDFTYNITSGSLQFDDNITGTLERDSGETVGNYTIYKGSLTLEDNNNGNNYNDNYNNGTLEIYKNDDNCSLYFSKDSPIAYNETFKVYTDCSTNYTLTRNNTEINNNSIQNLTIGNYFYEVERIDQENYSNIYDSEYFSVDKYNTSLDIVLEPSKNEYYKGDYIDIEGINCPSSLNCSLFLGNESIDNPYYDQFLEGKYIVEYNTTGNENYTADSVTREIIVKEKKFELFFIDFSKTSNIVLLIALFIIPFVLIYFFKWYGMASLTTMLLGTILIFNGFNLVVSILIIGIGVYIAFLDSDNIKNKIIDYESK